MRRYLLGLLVAALGFMALAVVQESQVFLPLIGLGEEKTSVPIGKEALAGARRAQAEVVRFNGAMQAAYRSGSTKALGAAPALEAELSAALQFSKRRMEPAPALESQRFVSVEPRPGERWMLLSEEIWTWPASASGPAFRSRLRFRYTLARVGKGLRVEQMKPVLPKPGGARGR